MSAPVRRTIAIADDDAAPLPIAPEIGPRVARSAARGAGRAFGGASARAGYRHDADAPSPRGEAKAARLHVGVGLSLEGQVRSCEELFVEGALEGDVEAEALRIGEEGRVKGQAQVSEADINGRFEGDLTVTGRLAVGAQGHIEGKVVYGALAVEEGGRIVGDVQHADVAERGASARRRAGLGLGGGRAQRPRRDDATAEDGAN